MQNYVHIFLSDSCKGAFTHALLRKWIHVFFKFVLFYSKTCVKAATVRCFSFPLFSMAPLKWCIGNGKRATCYCNAFRTMVVPAWKRGMPKDPFRFKNWFKLSVRAPSYGCTREEGTLEEGTISVFLSLKEFTESRDFFINALRNGTF